jgi:glycosyltransferase involved in cell wall biosynthesis
MGGGTPIKLLEAAAHRVPIVATRFGAEGTNFKSGHDIMLADDDTGFVDACTKLLTNRKLAARTAERAYRTVQRDHDPTYWARELGRLAMSLTGDDNPAANCYQIGTRSASDG